MNDWDPITIARLVYLVPEATADDYAKSIFKLIADVGDDVLANKDLKSGTKVRARLAQKDLPLAISALIRMLTTIVTNDEQRENVVFLVAKAVDDALNLGAFYMTGRSEDDLPSVPNVRSAGSSGGERGTATRRAEMAIWQSRARPLIEAERLRNPQLSDEALAIEVIKEANKQGIGLRGARSVAEYVRDLVKIGEIAPGAVDGRKKVRKRSASLPK